MINFQFKACFKYFGQIKLSFYIKTKLFIKLKFTYFHILHVIDKIKQLKVFSIQKK